MRYLFLLLFLNACALPPAIQVTSIAKTTYDAVRIANDEKSLNDIVISEIVKKECKTRNIIEGKEYCEKTVQQKIKEYIKELAKEERRKQNINNKN